MKLHEADQKVCTYVPERYFVAKRALIDGSKARTSSHCSIPLSISSGTWGGLEKDSRWNGDYIQAFRDRSTERDVQV